MFFRLFTSPEVELPTDVSTTTTAKMIMTMIMTIIVFQERAPKCDFGVVILIRLKIILKIFTTLTIPPSSVRSEWLVVETVDCLPSLRVNEASEARLPDGGAISGWVPELTREH
jgi:hypothetical protein